MSFWSAAVAIVAILAFTAMRISAYRAGIDPRSHRRDRRHEPAIPSPREEELAREVDDLHQRIAVLERIATDANSPSERRSKAISDEIEALRDR